MIRLKFHYQKVILMEISDEDVYDAMKDILKIKLELFWWRLQWLYHRFYFGGYFKMFSFNSNGIKYSFFNDNKQNNS
jgi:hypothetical protein